jgi:hypothetical protein
VPATVNADPGNFGVLSDDTAVMVRFPRTLQEERGNRDEWSWLPGTTIQQCGPDE